MFLYYETLSIVFIECDNDSKVYPNQQPLCTPNRKNKQDVLGSSSHDQ
jgi:hypothetical protein